MKYTVEMWTPIFEACDMPENKYELAVEYIERLRYYEQENNITVACDVGYPGLVPINLRVLSKLNFDDIDIRLSNESDETVDMILKEPININEFEDIKGGMGLDIIDKIENKLIEELTTLLNSKKEIIISRLVSNINIITENEGSYLVLSSKIKMI